MIRQLLSTVALLLLSVLPVLSQTSLGLILGKVTDDVDRHPLISVVTATHVASGSLFKTSTGSSGYYVLPLLPPGIYTLDFEVEGHRSSRIEEVEVPVGGFVEQNSSLRLLTDLWQRHLGRRSFSRDNKTVLPFYGPDVDTGRSIFVDRDRSP